MSEPAWIKCNRGHEVRVFPMGLEAVLQIRVAGVPVTTTLLGPTARRELLEALGGDDD